MARRAPGSWKAQAEKKICSEKRYLFILFIYLFTHTTTSSLLAEAINVEVNMVDE